MKQECERLWYLLHQPSNFIKHNDPCLFFFTSSSSIDDDLCIFLRDYKATMKQSQQNSCTYSKFITIALFKTCKGVLMRLSHAHYRTCICVTCPFPYPVNRTYLVLLVTKTCLPSFTFFSL